MNYCELRNRLIQSFEYRSKQLCFKLKDGFYSGILGREKFPREVHIENTNSCNSKCIMCPREKMTRKRGFMDFDFFKRLIDECSEKWQVEEVHLHGYGESLLEKDFHLRVAYAKKRGIKSTYIVTNGSLLSKEISRKLILAGLGKIKISFYGATKQTYEKIHVGLNFDKVVQNILDLLKERDETRRNNPSVYLQFLPQEENIHEKELFREKWSEFIDESRGDSLLEYQLHNYGLGKMYNLVKTQAKKKTCLLPFDTIQILWNGDVVPCCFDFNADMVVTNVRNKSIEEAWNSKAFKKFRYLHKINQLDKIPLCARCDQFQLE